MKSSGASNRPSLAASFILATFVVAASFVSAARAGAFGASPSAPGAGDDGWAIVSDSPSAASSPAPASSAAAAAPSVAASTVSPAASPSAALSKIGTVTVPGATPESDANLAVEEAQNATELPQAPPSPPQGSPQQQATPNVTTGLPSGSYNDGAIQYEQLKDTDLNGPPIRSLQDFMSQGDVTSPLGMEVREDRRKVNDSGEADGLLIVNVVAGSPAAKAGLHSYHRAVRDALETAAVAGSLFFPPAVLMVPVLDQVHVGESYDMIIAVDGNRVTNLLDLQDRLRDVQPGEIVYLTVIRNGQRVQIPVQVPGGTGPLD
jgi:PDZ domain